MDENLRPSKTQRKQEMVELQTMGERMVQLNESQIATIEMPESLRDAVLEARRMKSHEARRRQMQFIGRLMRDVDPAPIRSKLQEWDGQSAVNIAQEHLLARWRERLLEDDNAMTEFVREYPGTDIRQLRALVRSTREDRAAGRPPRNFRELFRTLRDIVTGSSSPTAEEPR